MLEQWVDNFLMRDVLADREAYESLKTFLRDHQPWEECGTCLPKLQALSRITQGLWEKDRDEGSGKAVLEEPWPYSRYGALPGDMALGKDERVLSSFPERILAQHLSLWDRVWFLALDTSAFVTTDWRYIPEPSMSPDLEDPVLQGLRRFSKVAQWCRGHILTGRNPCIRGQRMERIVRVAYYLQALGNLHGTMAVLTGLEAPQIRRLSKSIGWMAKRERGLWEDLRVWGDPEMGWRGVRRSMWQLERSSRGRVNEGQDRAWTMEIPFLGIWLRDLALNSSLPDTLEGGERDLLHLQKVRVAGRMALKVQGWKRRMKEMGVEIAPRNPMLWGACGRMDGPGEHEAWSLSIKQEPQVTSSSSGRRMSQLRTH